MNFCSGKRFLITGGAGFIGSHLAEELCRQGAEVTVFDNFSTGKKENLSQLAGSSGFRMIEGDIRDLAAVDAAVSGADYVLHQAAIASVAISVDRPEEVFSVNVQGFANVLSMASKHGIRRVVFASSSAVYGNKEAFPLKEDQGLAPISTYGLTKKFNEEMALVFFEGHGLQTIGLRYFNIFGTRQSAVSSYAAVIPKWARAASANEPITIYGDGSQTRDFTHVKNVVAANLLAISTENEAALGSVFNVGSGQRTRITDLEAEFRKISGSSAPLEFLPSPSCEIRDSVACLSRAKTQIGYELVVPFSDGLRETIHWYRA